MRKQAKLLPKTIQKRSLSISKILITQFFFLLCILLFYVSIKWNCTWHYYTKKNKFCFMCIVTESETVILTKQEVIREKRGMHNGGGQVVCEGSFLGFVFSTAHAAQVFTNDMQFKEHRGQYSSVTFLGNNIWHKLFHKFCDLLTLSVTHKNLSKRLKVLLLTIANYCGYIILY